MTVEDNKLAVTRALAIAFDPEVALSSKRVQLSAFIEQVFLVATLPPWYTNTLKRIAKTPKLHFLDSGLLTTTRGLSFDRLKTNRGEFGALLESFVFSEILKLMTGSDLRLTPYHFRDQQMHEVDIVLERDNGMIVGIEVKAAATVKSGDFAGLRTLAEACRDRFAYGVVLYDSGDLVPFGEKLAAAPLPSLWGDANRYVFSKVPAAHMNKRQLSLFPATPSNLRSNTNPSPADIWPERTSCVLGFQAITAFARAAGRCSDTKDFPQCILATAPRK